MIGTGASAVQFVPPVAEQAAHTTVFQRTGNWFLPRRNRPYPRPYRWLIEHVPGVQWARRAVWFWILELLTLTIRHPRTVGRIWRTYSWVFMRGQLRDHPELRERIWPDYTFGCKRILFSSTFLPTLAREDVEVTTEPIERLAPEGVVTRDGRTHAVDCVIYGTGFRTTAFMFPMEITGAGGRSLADVWADGARAHLGMTVPGFPSLYVMYGPNTNTSGGSIIAYLEAQAGYIRQAIELQRERGAAAVRAPRGRGGLGPRGAGALRRHGLDAVRLLVPRRQRPDRHPVARLHARVLRADPAAGAGRVRARSPIRALADDAQRAGLDPEHDLRERPEELAVGVDGQVLPAHGRAGQAGRRAHLRVALHRARSRPPAAARSRSRRRRAGCGAAASATGRPLPSPARSQRRIWRGPK